MCRTENQWLLLERLIDIILINSGGNIVEIGAGPSTIILNKHVKELNITHYICDISPKKCEWAERDLDNVIAYTGKSLDFIKTFPNVPVGVVFIDGDHAYDTVTQEVNFFFPKLVMGGIMFLHDTYPPERWMNDEGRFCGDVYKLRQELEERDDTQIFTWPYTAGDCGFSMVMKKDTTKQFCYGEFYPWDKK